MLFATRELAARVEAAEVRLLDACLHSVERHRGAAIDALRLPIAGGIAVHAAPGSPFVKVAGLGFAGIPDPARMDEIEREFAARGSPVVAEVATLADPALWEFLGNRGYQLRGVENVLGRAIDRAEHFPTRADLRIERHDAHAAAAGDLDTWLDTLVTGFAHPDEQGIASHETFPREAIERDVADMATTPGFSFWLAREAERAVGAAGMRIDAGIAQLVGAATLPDHRRRGVQTELLFARLAAAARAGCELAVLTAQPGSKSQQNAQRRGFALLYARLVMVLTR